MGLEQPIPPVSTPFLPGREKKGVAEKVASILLKIGQQVAYRYALIATRAFRNCQKSYGFKLIWSYDNFSTEFSFLRDLLRILNLGKIKLVVFFPGRGVTYIKNALVRFQQLVIGFHLPKSNIWGQNPYGRKNDLNVDFLKIYWRFSSKATINVSAQFYRL